MPRPRKSGLDDMFRSTSLDDKEEELRTIHGNDGWTALQLIYMNCWQRGCPEFDLSNDAKVGTLARKALVTVEKLREMIATMVDVGLFDPDEYIDKKVLTSDGLCRRISAVLKKRDNNRQVSDEFQPPKLDRNSTETRLLLDPTVQVDLDHKKDLDLKKDQGGIGGEVAPAKVKLGEHGNVWLSESDITRFKSEHGDECFEWRVATFDSWIESLKQAGPPAKARDAIAKGLNAHTSLNRWLMNEWNTYRSKRDRAEREALYAKKAAGSEFPRHIQQSINYTDALLAEARRQDAEDEKRKKLMVN